MAKEKAKLDGIRVLTRFVVAKYSNGRIVDQCSTVCETRDEALAVGSKALDQKERDRVESKRRRKAEEVLLAKKAEKASETVVHDILPPAGETFGDGQ